MRIKGQQRSERVQLRMASHFPSLRSDSERSATAHMFIEDVKLAVMPFRFHGHDEGNKEYKVEITGGKSEREKAISLLRSLARHDRYSLEELLSESVEQVVMHLAWNGRAVHEIIRGENPPDISLYNFTPQRLVRFFQHYIQLIPMGDRDLFGRAYSTLPKKDIWLISMPGSLGGYRGYRRLLNKLKKFQDVGPKFYMKAIENEHITEQYNFGVYRREAEIFIHRATQRWGWTNRDMTNRYLTEFARLYKRLTFKWAQATLRDHVILEFNALLNRLDIAAKVNVTGLTSPAEFLHIRDEISAGNVSFKDAYKAIML